MKMMLSMIVIFQVALTVRVTERTTICELWLMLNTYDHSELRLSTVIKYELYDSLSGRRFPHFN